MALGSGETMPTSSSSCVVPVDIILIFSRGRELAVDHADVGDHAAVDVVDRVEDHRPGGRVGVTDRRGDQPDHLVEQLADAHAGLAGHPQHVARARSR